MFGIYGHREAANFTYLGLYALQHRGQEGSGIVSSDERNFYMEKGIGLVSDIFTKKEIRRLRGNKAIGHNRYSTCLLYTSPSPRDRTRSRMPSSA